MSGWLKFEDTRQKALREEYENREEGDTHWSQAKLSIHKEVRQASVVPRARVGRKEEPGEIGVPYWHSRALAVFKY